MKLDKPEYQPPKLNQIPAPEEDDPFSLPPVRTPEQELLPGGKLNVEQYQLLKYLEQRYNMTSSIPSYQELVADDITLSNGEDTYWECWSNTRFVRALAGRGIPEWLLAKITRSGTVFDKKLLSEKQMHVANIMLDTLDKRSKIKKLTEAGVTTKQYSEWLRDPLYRQYVLERSEGILQESQPIAHLALVERVNQGDLGAIKYYNSMVGRYREARAGGGGGNVGVGVQVNVGSNTLNDMAFKIIQVIQKYVKDPETLRAMGNDIMALANNTGSGTNAGSNVISGAGSTAELEPPVGVGKVTEAEMNKTSLVGKVLLSGSEDSIIGGI